MMKCSQTRNHVLAYLDSELDARTSREIELHLESCDACREIYRLEKRFAAGLASALDRGEATPSLWRRIEQGIAATATEKDGVNLSHEIPVCRSSSCARRGRLRLAAAVILPLLGALGLLGWWASDDPLDLAEAAESTHRSRLERFEGGENSPGPTPSELRAVADRLDPAAFGVRPKDPAFTADGARICKVGHVPVALVEGRYLAEPVSLIVMKAGELSHFPETRNRLGSREAIACSPTASGEFAARRTGDHVVSVIGDLPRPELERLLASVPVSGGVPAPPETSNREEVR